MASHHFAQNSSAPFESPAKVFAKLKLKLQREAELPHMMDVEQAFSRRNMYGAAEQHRERLLTPRQRTESHCANRDTGSVSSEVTALTLSSMSSPENNYRPEEDELSRMLEMESAFKHKRPYMSEERAFIEAYLESTAVCRPSFQHPHTDTHEREEPAELSYCEPEVLLEDAGHPHQTPPASVFSPMMKRLRRRHWDEQALNHVKTRTSEVDYGPGRNKDGKMSSVVRDDDCTHPEEPTGNTVAVEAPHTDHMSPMKMVNYLVERENRRGQGDSQKVLSSRRWSTSNDDSEVMASTSPVSSVDRMKSSDSEEVRDEPAAVSSQPVLYEDPLLLTSPQFSIPHKQVTASKRATVPQCPAFPDDNVIYLRKWDLKKSKKGLFVDGIHSEMNIPWHSNVIIDRVSNTTLKTVTGRIYILVGKMVAHAPAQFPKWFLKSFANGFPKNWKELYNKYLSNATGNLNQEKKNKGDLSMKRLRLRTQYPKSCSSAAPSTKVSRSGRLIKPPLEYWKGGRVMLDADMNVTVYQGYDTTISQPETTIVFSNPAVSSKKHTGMMVPQCKACDLHKSISNTQPVVLLQKVKVPQHKPHQTKVSAKEKTHSPKKNTGETERGAVQVASKSTARKTSRNKSLKGVQQSPPQLSTNGNAVKTKMNVKSPGEEKPGTIKRKRPTRGRSEKSPSCSNSDKDKKLPKNNVQKRRTKTPMPSPQRTQLKTSKGTTSNTSQQQDEEGWTEEELKRLDQAMLRYPKHIIGYWTKVAKFVGSRSADECYNRHTCSGTSKTPAKASKKAKVPLKVKAVDPPVISARARTWKRKKQEREFLEAMPKDDMDDVFSSAYMQNKRSEVPSMCMSDDHDFTVSNWEPLTPGSTGFPEVKTPQGLHITPGMMGSSSRNYDDKYVYQLQRRMKNKYQFNVHKHAQQNFTPAASAKKQKRCATAGTDSFVVWKMFPDKETPVDREEEQDFYFSDTD